MELFNKSNMTFAIKVKGEPVLLKPNTTTVVDKEEAEKLLKLYPNDLVAPFGSERAIAEVESETAKQEEAENTAPISRTPYKKK